MLRRLEQASLITLDAHGRYGMHDLIRSHATTTAHSDLADDVREAALRRVLDYYLRTAHTADRLLDLHRTPIRLGPPAPGTQPHPLPDVSAAMAWFDAEYSNLLAAQHTATTHGWHHTIWQLAWTLDTFHCRRGHRHDDLAVWQAALDAATHLRDPATRTRAHRRLGSAYSRLGQHEKAVRHLDQALALAEHHYNPTEQAQTHRLLAVAWERMGHHGRALDHAEDAVAIFRTLDLPMWEASSLNVVGWCAAHLGDYDTARDHCQDALTLSRRHHYVDGQAAALDGLGWIDHHTGRRHQAIHHYRQAFILFRDVGHTYDSANTLDNLGHPHAALGHPYAALGQHDQAHAVWREALELYRAQGRDADAERVQQQLDTLDDTDTTGQPAV